MRSVLSPTEGQVLLRPERRLRLSPRSGPRSGFNCEHARTLWVGATMRHGSNLRTLVIALPQCDALRARRGLHAYACQRSETTMPASVGRLSG